MRVSTEIEPHFNLSQFKTQRQPTPKWQTLRSLLLFIFLMLSDYLIFDTARCEIKLFGTRIKHNCFLFSSAAPDRSIFFLQKKTRSNICVAWNLFGELRGFSTILRERKKVFLFGFVLQKMLCAKHMGERRFNQGENVHNLLRLVKRPKQNIKVRTAGCSVVRKLL